MDFQIGELVAYSDLSPWEFATVLRRSTQPNMDWVLEFEFDDCDVQEDGMRRLTKADRRTMRFAEGGDHPDFDVSGMRERDEAQWPPADGSWP